MIRICTIIGTRPEAIKMAVLLHKLSAHQNIKHVLCVTAQHREMLDQVLDFFELKPDIDLDIMEPEQKLADVTAKIITTVNKTLDEIRPDLVLVHGDTTTCMAASLAAFYLRIPVGHVEAGLRTFNFDAPFPEEANRVITDKIANYHFAPTKLNAENLLKEGITNDQIIITGNTVIDSLQFTSKKVKGFSSHVTNESLRKLNESDKIILITGHRRENFGDGFRQISEAIRTLAIDHPEIKFIYPVHLNPAVKQTVIELLSGIDNIILCNPLQYSDFVYLMKISWIILTDSGGIQEEAPSLGKPVLVMREVTERPEAVDAGTVKLVGARTNEIIQSVNKLLDDENLFKQMSSARNPYGDGNASERILQWIIQHEEQIMNKG